MRSFDETQPIAVALHLLLTAGIAMFCLEPLLLGISLIGAVTFCTLREGVHLWRFHGSMLVLYVSFVLICPLMSQHGETPILVLCGRVLTLEALRYGAIAGEMLVTVLYWFHALTDLMTADKLQQLLRPFAPRFALVLSMALRNVSLFRHQMRKIHDAQVALGVYAEDHPLKTARGRVRECSILVTWGLENGIVTADSMAARGYGTSRRSHYTRFPWRSGDVCLFLTTAALGVIVLIPILQGVLSCTYYPIYQPPAHGVRYVCCLLGYAVLAFLPTLHELCERARWRG